MKITKHFKREEFDCNDGTPYPKDWLYVLNLLCSNLEKIRSLTGQTMIILSGYRTRSWNSHCGGARHSQHILGLAADIKLKGMSSKQLYKAVCKLIEDAEINEGGVGLYRWGVHYDMRGHKTNGSVARWNHYNKGR